MCIRDRITSVVAQGRTGTLSLPPLPWNWRHYHLVGDYRHRDLSGQQIVLLIFFVLLFVPSVSLVSFPIPISLSLSLAVSLPVPVSIPFPLAIAVPVFLLMVLFLLLVPGSVMMSVLPASAFAVFLFVLVLIFMFFTIS